MASEAPAIAPQLMPKELFRALGDETRLRALVLLQAERELCVCELTYALEVSQPKMSRHLAHLREAGLVSDRRAGLWIHYRIAPDLPHWAAHVLSASGAALAQESRFIDDRRRLGRMPERPGGRCAG